MNKLELFFQKPTTAQFQFWSWSAIALFFLLIVLLMMNGCRSFEKTTGYKQNEYWGK